MKKILYIATTADNINRLDGETVKCRLLREYLNEIDKIEVISIDTDNWRKHIIKLIILILFYFIRCDEIVISSADKGANIVLNFFRKINTNKKIYYFVIGGSLSKNIKEKNWNIETYTRINHIYVEASNLKNDLKKLNINNVDVLNNFRKVEKFDNKYVEESNFRFVYYGRVIKEKGVEEAIKLVKRLNLEGKKCNLSIYGQCADSYKKYILSKFDNNIKYYGELVPNGKDEYEVLSKYDAFIFPTEYPGECLPGALIDCYISGLAVLASNWKYAKEYIEDGKNGYIFEYKNYNDMYTKALELIDNHVQLQRFKKKSKQLSKKYLMENTLNKVKQELLGEIDNEEV